MTDAAGQESIKFASGLSGHAQAVRAAEHACERIRAELDKIDLATVFISAHHIDAAQAVAAIVRRRLTPRCLVGVSAESVLAGEVELEQTPGIAIMGARLPGVGLRPFRLEELGRVSADSPPETVAERAGMSSSFRGMMLLADPFSVPVNTLLPALSRARLAARPALSRRGPDAPPMPPILGGMASAASKPGGNVLFLNDQLMRSGAVGVSFSGRVRIDSLVSQGCRPFGPIAVITGAKGQIITTLGGRPALDVLREAIEGLDEPTRELLKRNIFMGRAVSEYKDRFGRGDFLVRGVVGVDQDSGALAVADLVRVGQTVQFHLRDAATADDDLGLLLDGQQVHDRPAGALLFTCNARGCRLFEDPNHDARAVSRAFMPEASAEQRAKVGEPMGPSSAPGRAGPSIPIAGFFAAGEIGPVGDEVFLHGHTASVMLFREDRPQVS